jgi:HPt (histidine-containing phosphotransfer) domain-containing protein
LHPAAPTPAAPTASDGPARWVELEVLADLEAELDGPELARGFARDYAAMWDLRFSRVAAAVRAHDRKAALDAVISLRIASAMVGGVRLAALAQALEDAIRHDDFVQGQALLAGVAEHGTSTVSELQSNYILKN